MKVILLSAGLGKRLRPFTLKRPKCLMPIKGVPLLQFWLDKLTEDGFGPFLINTHYFQDQVEDFIEENSFNKEIDLFSLDIDGIDYWILKKIPSDFSKIIVVEYNSNFGHELEVTVPNIKKFNRTKYHYSNLCFGTSMKALINLLEKKNYTFVGTDISKLNAFFVSNLELNKISLNIPNKNDLQKFTDSNLRESRNENGHLSYLSGNKKINEIKNCKIVDVSNDNEKLLTIKELYNLK